MLRARVFVQGFRRVERDGQREHDGVAVPLRQACEIEARTGEEDDCGARSAASSSGNRVVEWRLPLTGFE